MATYSTTRLSVLVALVCRFAAPAWVCAQTVPHNHPPAQTAHAVARMIARAQPVFGPGEPNAEQQPLHPPIDQIPPMPMPSDAADAPVATDTITWHDARTGETRQLPSALPSGRAGDGGDGCVGVDGAVMPVESLRSLGPMSTVSAFGSFPESTTCKLVMKFVDQGGSTLWYSCSGAMQDSAVVLTAAHCVYARNPDGNNIYDWAREIWVYPGWDGGGATSPPVPTSIMNSWGYAYGTQYIAGTDYINNGNYNRDVGAIALSRGDSRSVGALCGWLGYAWGYTCPENLARTYYNFSYPSESCDGGLHDGRTLYYRSGSFDVCVGNRLQTFTAAGCLTAVWGGMSGSNAYYLHNADQRRAHAVCSTSDRYSYGRYCKLWEQFANDLNAFRADARGSVFDLEALRFRLLGGLTVQAGTTTSNATFIATNATNADPPPRTYSFSVYLSTNSQITPADTLLATYSFDHDFAPMQSLDITIQGGLSIPPLTNPGTYYIGVILDSPADAVPANNDTLAWDTQPIIVTQGPPPPPANNTCGNPTTLAVGGAVLSGSTTNATNSGSSSCGNSAASPDVWFRVTPPISGTLVLDTCGSLFDTVLSLHSSCPGDTANQLRCNDDRPGDRDPCSDALSSQLTVGVTGGTTYFVRLSGYQGAGGGYVLRAFYDPPSNDLCGSAAALAAGAAVAGTLAGAANDGTSSCGLSATAADAWYLLTPPQSGNLRIDTCGSDFDTTLSVHTACPGSVGNQVACNDDAATGACAFTQLSSVDLGVIAGQSYLIRVSGYAGALGAFILRSQYLAPANNACPAATFLQPGTSTSGSTIASTNDGAASCGNSSSSPDVWYRVEAPCTGLLRIDTCGSSFDTVLSVHAGCPGTALNQIACNDDHDSGPGGCAGLRDSAVEFLAAGGATYFVRVAGFAGAAGAFTISVRYVHGPPSDDCESAPVVGDGAYVFTNCGASTDGPAEDGCGFGFGDNQINHDLWLTYSTITPRRMTIDTCSSISPVFDTKIAVYPASECPGAEHSASICNDDAGAGCGSSPYLSRVRLLAPAGGVLIRVGGYRTSSGTATLTISSFCPADFNRGGSVTLQDVFDYLDAWFTSDPEADMDQSGTVTIQDIFTFLGDWFAGC
ncbi:MAG: GC-type dockerin domain-anchored protein [Phycisphaerales bacterium]